MKTMKVILIKDCKDGKANAIIEVKNGYGKNFLIAQGFALPYNHKIASHVMKNVVSAQQQVAAMLEDTNKVKEAIEHLTLQFKIKSNNGILHNSISKKQIVHELRENKIKVDPHAIENFKIHALGLINVKINLSKHMQAILKVEVLDGN